jgi:hypothetical protein
MGQSSVHQFFCKTKLPRTIVCVLGAISRRFFYVHETRVCFRNAHLNDRSATILILSSIKRSTGGGPDGIYKELKSLWCCGRIRIPG